MPFYKIEIVKAAQKEISKLPKIYYQPVRDAVLQLAENPKSKNSKKLKGVEKTYRIKSWSLPNRLFD